MKLKHITAEELEIISGGNILIDVVKAVGSLMTVPSSRGSLMAAGLLLRGDSQSSTCSNPVVIYSAPTGVNGPNGPIINQATISYCP